MIRFPTRTPQTRSTGFGGPALACAAWAFAAASFAGARPVEQVSFQNVPSNGVLNSPSNGVRTHVFTGGFPLGRVDLSGTLTAVHPATWRTDSRVVVTAPGGQSTVFQPFVSGGTYTSLPFSGTVVLPPGTPTIGEWAFRFFEAVDDGGAALVDASWNITITLTDQPPQPPAFVNLGRLGAPGPSIAGIPFGGGGGVKWYRFTLAESVLAPLNSYLDIDTLGSALPVSPSSGLLPDDTELALYDASGSLLVLDDDSGDGATSQLTFGVGTRPAVGNGLPYNGRHGPLAPGTYYLGVGPHNIEFGPTLWNAVPTFGPSGTITLNLRTNLGEACPADCSNDGLLTVADFGCFQTKFVAGDAYADCTNDGQLTVADFGCFQTGFVAGCP